MPVEAQIHIKALAFINGICLQGDFCIEKQLAHRQISLKTYNSISWFVSVNRILLKYNLPVAKPVRETKMENYDL